jgi:RHS repeat-associated protein
VPEWLVREDRGSFGRLLLCALIAAATSAPVSADQYGYDELGNVETLSNPRGVRSYTYDEIQRLDTETGYTGNRDHAYDLNGNRTTDGASAPGTPTTATYTSNTNRIATLNGAAVTLDAAGQITNDGLNSYTWDDAGRLKTVSRGGQLRATYYYDHKHRRTRKVTTAAAPQGAKTLVYHYDDQDRLIAETTETGAPVRSYLWADATLLAQVEYTLNATTGLYTVSRELLFELDHLGTPRQARLNTGTAVWRWESDGYGNTLPNEDPDGNGQKTYVYLRFPGQYFDEESGLHYNWHRYYVPRLGRYLSSDPIGIEGGRNSYGYVEGNPLSYYDPYGLFGMDDVWGGVYWATDGWSPSQNTVDFGAGFGDVVTFGLTRQARSLLDINNVNRCSNWYAAGEVAGVAATTATGFFVGTRWFARQASPNNWSNFSHSGTPQTWQRGSWWSRTGNRANGDYIPTTGRRPDLHDFMDATAARTAGNYPTWPAWRRAPNRIPYTPGAALYGGASAAMNACECRQ